MQFWLISASLAFAAPVCEPVDYPAWIADVREHGREEAYLCLAHDAGAAAPLMQAIEAVESPDSGRQRRLQRALAIHVMQRLDQPADVAALRAINASDRRLLRDAVHARRGRKSPVPEHAAVFEKFDWYHPSPRFTNRSLDATDRENLVVIDRPPSEETPASTTDAPAIDAMPKGRVGAPKPANTTGACGCAATDSTHQALWLLAPMMGLLRRRTRQTPVGSS